MKYSGYCLRIVAASFLGLGLACAPAAAQQGSSVGGLIVNFGLTPAAVALRTEGHRDAHPANPPSGSQHLLITLDEEKYGTRVSTAEIVVEVTDPRGGVERKPMLHTQGGGLPDYSELFLFRWSGEYSIRVIVTPRPGAKPVEAIFKVKHSV